MMFYCDARSYTELLFAENIPPLHADVHTYAGNCNRKSRSGRKRGKKGFQFVNSQNRLLKCFRLGNQRNRYDDSIADIVRASGLIVIDRHLILERRKNKNKIKGRWRVQAQVTIAESFSDRKELIGGRWD